MTRNRGTLVHLFWESVMTEAVKSHKPKRRGLYTALGLTTVLGFAGMGYLALMGGAVAAEGSAYDYEFTSIDGAPLPLEQYRGKTVLLVNTASQCGLPRNMKACKPCGKSTAIRAWWF